MRIFQSTVKHGASAPGWVLVFLCVVALLSVSCSHRQQADPAEAEGGVLDMSDDLPNGLRMRIREASTPAPSKTQDRQVSGEPLPQETIDALYRRLEALPEALASQVDFALRTTSKPAPRAGKTVEKAFPPPSNHAGAPPEAADSTLTLRRYQPEGNVELAPKLSLTFSQGVVPLTGHQDASKVVPATISPALEGTWRWVGTQTAIFDPADGRFPMASAFTVTPNAALVSASGASLENADAWTFQTPAVQIEQSLPTGEGNVRTPIFVLQFDQRIDDQEILQWIEVEARGSIYELVQATDHEIDRDDAAKRALANAKDGRWIAFRTKEALPAATKVTTRLRKGAPSAEGPRTTTQVQERSFRTFDALKVTYQSCEKSAPCAPNGQWYVNFNNPLDEDAFQAKQVSVSPEVSNLETRVEYGRLTLRGNFKARTTYTVTLDASLKDTHGQTLAKPTQLTFHIGEAPQMLGAATDMLTTLDPALQGKFPFYHQNYNKVRVRAWTVTPEDWSGYLGFVQKRNEERYAYNQTQKPSATPPGQLAWDETLTLKHTPDELTETLIDLQRALNPNGKGHVILQIEVLETKSQRNNDIYRRPYIPEILTWIQVTDLSLHASWDGKQMLAWTAQLSNGAPIEGAEVHLAGRDNITGRTDASGMATLAFEPRKRAIKATETLLIARKDGDSAFLPERQHAYAGDEISRWQATTQQTHLLSHLFDDRAIYQPGESVHVKGWVRFARTQRDQSLRIPTDATATYTVRGPRRNTLAEGDVMIDADGAFDLAFDLPDDVNLGYATLSVNIQHADLPSGAQSVDHGFQIQEFRRPEFEVNVSKSDGPFLVGAQTELAVQADYYAGGGLSEAPVRWTLQSNEGRYTPPNQQDYQFGRWNPWWWWGGSAGVRSSVERLEGTTDASGQHRISLAFEGVKPALPMTVSAQAAVEDVNRQTWQASTTLLVHPSDRYVGLRTEKNFVEAGKTFTIESIVTDIDGAIQTGHAVKMTAARLDWQYKNGRYDEVETDTLRCDVQSKDSAQPCEFTPKKSGAWLVRATVYDDLGRPNTSELRVWVGNQAAPPDRRAQQQEVRMIPDQESYKVGDTATIMMLAPFKNAEALITVRQGGIVTQQRVAFEGDSHAFTWKLTEKDVPNVGIQVDLVGDTARVDNQGKALKNAGERPAWAAGNIELQVPPERKALHIELTPQAEALSPGAATHVDLVVKDADGRPADRAHLTLIAVDEAILALTQYTLQNPLESFYPNMSQETQDMDLHAFLVLATSQDLLANDAQGDEQIMYEAESMGMGGAPAPRMMARNAMMMKSMAADDSADAAVGGGADASIDVRQDFNPLAVFAARSLTDANGRARVSFDLPDNLTRYRVMAVASRGAEQFGTAEKNITAQLPLMVRPSPPRFLNYGDQLDIPVVVQNQTDRPLAVDVVARASNLTLLDPMGQRVQVPANDRVEVRFSARADKAGTAHLQVVATSGTFADAATQSFPVWTPATTEAFATYGTLDGASEVKRQPVVPLIGVIQDFGALEVTTSSSAVQSLTDALIYLVGYPFESAEHIASRILGVTALTPVLSAFESESLPKEEELKKAIERDLAKLGRLQRHDGGFYLWSHSERTRFVFAEVHVAHALWRAQEAGYTVDAKLLQRAQRFLQNIERALPSDYSEQTKNTVRAYAFYVRSLFGDDVQKDVVALSQKTPQKALSLEAIGWILSTLKPEGDAKDRVRNLTRYVENLTEETSATAQFTTSYSDEENYVLMHSSRRTDAILLEAWMHTQPQSDLIPKLVRGLETHKTHGRWLNTQENAFVLLALRKYFDTYEAQTPNFVANLWLGKGFAGEHRFKGRSLDYQHTTIPMQDVVTAHNADNAQITLQKLGKGRLYYRLGMRYALKDLSVPPAEHGFSVTRTYEGLDDPYAVTQAEDGTWNVRLGERVRVRVTMVAPARRHHVALIDPLPAGFEALNPALAVTESLPKDADTHDKVRPFWWGFARWYTHQNLRDERAEAFANILPAGVYEYTYVVRATTPGTFVVPPAKAEEMYYPETFGRTSNHTVRIQ